MEIVQVQKRINFVDNDLVKKIMSSNTELKDHKIVSSYVTQSTQLDGFMSVILTLDLVTQSLKPPGEPIKHSIIVKLMKGDPRFRMTTKSYQQFSNEVYIYGKVIPAFRELLEVAGVTTIKVDDWIPKVYFADFGRYPSLSDSPEAVIAIENLRPKGFRNGPRLDLDEPHLTLMIKTIADYHSLTYAMRLQKNPKLEELKRKIIDRPFEEPNGDRNIHSVVFKVAMDRYFAYLDRWPKYREDQKFFGEMEKLRAKYYKQPLKLMERLRRDDPQYSVILHGDYNRNNVMFRYEKDEGYEGVKEMRMIDFQEVRYGSPAIDLSFFMYFNINPDLHEQVWTKLLKLYSDIVTTNLSNILKVPKTDKLLEPYNYNNLDHHFCQFAYYGIMVAYHFLPCMMASEKDCTKLSTLFTENLLGKEFYDFSMIAGGEEPDERMVKISQHAVKMGYTKIFDL